MSTTFTYHYEYRITKKGCECYRSGDLAETKAKLEALSAKRPGVYAMQSRSVRVNRLGQWERCGDKISWSPWQ